MILIRLKRNKGKEFRTQNSEKGMDSNDFFYSVLFCRILQTLVLNLHKLLINESIFVFYSIQKKLFFLSFNQFNKK